KIVTLQANGWEWARKTFGTAPAQEGKDPAKAFTNDFKINAFLDQAAVARVAFADSTHLHYLCKAIQLTSVDHNNIMLPALVVYAPTDKILAESSDQETIQKIGATGGSVESATLVGPNGHLNAITEIGQAASKITAFLGK